MQCDKSKSISPGNTARIKVQPRLDVVERIADNVRVGEKVFVEDVFGALVDFVEPCANVPLHARIHRNGR